MRNRNGLNNTTRSTNLVCHANLVCPGDSISDAVGAVEVELDQSEPAILRLRYSITGDMRRVRIPALNSPSRQDGLWQHTCFEVFVKGPDEAYCEFNFSPSRQWAAFCFDAYREGMAQMQLSSAPLIHVESLPGGFVLEAVVDLKGLINVEPGDQAWLGLAAVIEDRDGSLSYWALTHPPGKADFHHSDGFVLALTDNDARSQRD